MKLLVVSSDPYPPSRVDVAVLFGEELAGRGHQIDWILQSEGACAKPYIARWGGGRAWIGATDLGNSLLNRLRKHVRGIANDCRLVGRLRTRAYDVIEVKDKFIAGLLAVVAARLFGTRFVYWLSYPFPEDYLSRAKDQSARYPWLAYLRGAGFKFILYRCLLPAADHIFVQSEQMREDLAALRVPLDKMTAVPMGISVDMFKSAEVEAVRERLPEGVPCVVYLGTLDRIRRLDFLIRSFALVREVMPDARLYMVGAGVSDADRSFLEAEVSRMRIDSAVLFTGQLPRPEALRYVREADVCVSPFFPTPVLMSTSPTKLIEYMAMARPVVANDHPEQRRIIDESGGGHCVPYEERAFAAAVIDLLKKPDMASRMGLRGRRYVIEHRTYDVIADLVERKFLAVVGSPA